MRRNVFLKTTLRRPVRAVLLLALLAFMSFSFVYRAVEYLVMRGEIERAEGYYRAIGTVSSYQGLAGDIEAGAQLVSKSEYVDFEDRRTIVAGHMQGMQHHYGAYYKGEMAYDDYRPPQWPHLPESDLNIRVTDAYFYGTLADIRYDSKRGPQGILALTFDVERLESGMPITIESGRQIEVIYFLYNGESQGENHVSEMKTGERYFVRTVFPYGREFNSYLSMWYSSPDHCALRPITRHGWYIPLEAGEYLDFTSEAYAPLRDEIDLVLANQSAIRVIGTADMTALEEFQESAMQHFLLEGRWLSREDSLSAKPVCVIPDVYAEQNGLQVGDTIHADLLDLQYAMGCIPYTMLNNPEIEPSVVPQEYGPGRTDFRAWIFLPEEGLYWRDIPSVEMQLEVVGIWKPKDPFYRYLIYVPNSILPAEYGGKLREALYTEQYGFVLKSPRDQKAFLEETGPALEELGLKAVFLDTGFDSFYASSSSMLRATLTNVVVFFLVMLASWMLLLFVYLRQGRRSFAISRALGLSRRDGVRQMLIPILGIGGTGIVLGGAVSWSYALKQAGETLSVLRDFENADPGTSFSAWWLAGICLALVVLFAAVSYIGVSASTRRPVLELLQDGAGKREKVGVQDSGTDAGSGHEDLSLLSETLRELEHSPAAGASVNAAALRFLWRQIRRSRLKSALTAALALCFTFALGWINNSIEENSAEIDRLYGRISVKAEIMNEPGLRPMPQSL